MDSSVLQPLADAPTQAGIITSTASRFETASFHPLPHDYSKDRDKHVESRRELGGRKNHCAVATVSEPSEVAAVHSISVGVQSPCANPMSRHVDCEADERSQWKWANPGHRNQEETFKTALSDKVEPQPQTVAMGRKGSVDSILGVARQSNIWKDDEMDEILGVWSKGKGS